MILEDKVHASRLHVLTRHVTTEEPGELAYVDAFYIGELKGVDKLWQIAACNAASSCTMAKLIAPAAQWRQDPSCSRS